MKPEEIALLAAVAGGATAMLAGMVPPALDCRQLPDSEVHRGYSHGALAVATLAAGASILARSWAPLAAGAAVVGVFCVAHDRVQRTGTG